MILSKVKNDKFWHRLDQLVTSSQIRIDRLKGSAHPRYPQFRYPFDYGYLEKTQVKDKGGLDVWIGSLLERKVTAIICNVDLIKKDSEIKLLLGCTKQESQKILKVHNRGSQSAILIPRPDNFSINK